MALLWLRRSFYVFVGLLFVYAVAGMFFTGPVVVRAPSLDLEVEPSPVRLRAAVEALCTEFAPRDWRHTRQLDAAASWIAGHLAASGLEVELQEYRLDAGTFRNVIGVRRGEDPAAAAIVMGAHYDAASGSPGADDNASGVAVLLELARTLPAVPHERTHYFVAFATEEPPFFGTDAMGSYLFARKLEDDGVQVRVMVALDLVGFYSDELRSQRFPSPVFRLFYPWRGDFALVVGDARSGEAIARVKRGLRAGGRLPIQSFRAPARSGLVQLSDHFSFRRLGLPAVQVTDTAFMRYPYWHRPEDTPEKLDYERMADLVRSLHGVLWEGR